MGNEIDVRNAGQLEYAMSVENVMAQVNAIQELMKRAMKENEHYGIIPGTSRKDKEGKEMAKPSLLKPGAEKLCMMFRLSPTYSIESIQYAGGHLEYRIICTLTNIRTGEIWGQGVGSCSSMETKYRFRNQKTDTGLPIPKDAKDNKGHYRAQGFCMAKDENDQWYWAKLERVEHDNPADYYNTVLKIAKKRSLVDGVLTCTAASDFFTQDLEDMAENGLLGKQGEEKQSSKADAPATPTTNGKPADTAQAQAPSSPIPQPGEIEPPEGAVETFKDKLFRKINGDVKELKRLTTFKGKDGEMVNGKSKWEWVSEAGAKAAYGRLHDEKGPLFGGGEQREPGQEG